MFSIPFAKSLRIVSLTALLAITPFYSSQAFFGDDEARNAILALRTQVSDLQIQVQETSNFAANQKDLILKQSLQIEKLQKELDTLRTTVAALEEKNATSAETASKDKSEFDAAYALFSQRNYKAAAPALQSFVANNPDSSYAANAQFYLGSALYGNKDYKGSIRTQQELLQKWPNSSHSADGMLIIAAAQVELSDVAGAKATLKKLMKSYPNSTAAKTAEKRLSLMP